MSAYHILHFRQKSFYYRFVGNIQVKQRIIGSIFPEKLIFEKNNYRTPKVNNVVSLICRASKEASDKKKGTKTITSSSSFGVVPTGMTNDI